MAPAQIPEADLRTSDWTRWLANLFLDGTHRDDVNTLFAFAAHIRGLSARVREPAMGEIRLRWWIDALEAATNEQAQYSPLGDALNQVLSRYQLSARPLVQLLQAHQFDFYNDLFPTTDDFEAFAGETAAIPLQLAAQIIVPAEANRLADACGHFGVAQSIARVLFNLPRTLQRQQLYLPADLLAASGVHQEQFFTPSPAQAVRGALETFAELGLSHLNRAHAAVRQTPQAARPLFLTAPVLDYQLRVFLDPKRYVKGGDLVPLEPSKLRQAWMIWRASKGA